jgi:GntR family transcriptional repressor for pyruvate dehydrogenase complex
MSLNADASAQPWTSPSDRMSGRQERRVHKVAEVIAREILSEITAQNLQPGAKLGAESEMLERYDIGRSSLREALRILEVYGVITIKPGPGGGPVVRRLNSRDFAHLMTFYLHTQDITFGQIYSSLSVLESMLARRAALEQPPEQMARIRDAMTGSTGNVDDSRRFGSEMRSFHAAIVADPASPLLAMTVSAFGEAIALRIGDAIALDEAKELLHDHEQIARAILDGDADLAERLAYEHRVANLALFERALPGVSAERVQWS